MVSTRASVRQPRDERVRIPQRVKPDRPSPIRITASKPAYASQHPTEDFLNSDDCQGHLRDPEIIELAAPTTWAHRACLPQAIDPQRIASPRLASRTSARQSELSFGILDYYIRDVSPLASPELRMTTPDLDGKERCVSPMGSPGATLKGLEPDPAIKQFDFGLPPLSPHRPRASTTPVTPAETPQMKAGAANESPPSAQAPCPQHKKGYSLFPTVQETRFPIKEPAASPPTQEKVPLTSPRSIPLHMQPDPSYRPRKESLTSSIRSRKDSCTSFRSSRQIPLRILSGSSTTSGNTQSTASVSASSPPQHSRWSDETIKSPTAATTPGLRTSFGSIMGRDSAQYPACFFEDEDERVPLRSKFAWKRSISLTQDRPAKKSGGRGRFDEKRSLGRRIARVLLCASCCA